MSFIDNIKEIPITDYAQRCGYTLVRKGQRYVSLAEHDSVMIDTQRNCFWRNSVFQKGQKGGAGSIIDFAMEFQGFERNKALRELAVMYGIEGDKTPTHREYKPVPKAREPKKREVGDLSLPPKAKNANEVFHYLNKERKIDLSVIKYFVARDMLYQDAEHNNCVFVSNKFACVRSTGEKRFMRDLEGCDYNECFFFRPSQAATTLVVAESVIDLMSIMTQFAKEGKRYTDYSYLALAGVNKLPSLFYHIEQEKDINHVMLAFDNDEAGKQAFEFAVDGLEKISFAGDVEDYSAPSEKDWNAYIQATFDEQQKKEQLVPLYTKDKMFAKENGEMADWRSSFKENCNCAKAIDKALNENYADNRLDTDKALNTVVAEYGAERVIHILAAQVVNHDWDGRYHNDVKAWAKEQTKELSAEFMEDSRDYYLNAHPILIDGLASKTMVMQNEIGLDKTAEEATAVVQQENATSHDKQKGEQLDFSNGAYRYFYVGEQDEEANDFAQQTGWHKIWASDSQGMNGDTWIVYRTAADLPQFLRNYALQQESISMQKEINSTHGEDRETNITESENLKMTEEKQRLFVDMDGTLAVFTPVDEMETLYEQGYFSNLKPHENVVAAIRDIIVNHPEIEVNILSAYLSDSQFALAEKNEWLNQHLPEIDQEHRIFVPCGSDKKEGVVGGIRNNDFLLDDYTKNLNDWQPPARGIKLLNAINHTRGSWEHDRIRYNREPSALSEAIVSVMREEQRIYDDKISADKQTNIPVEEIALLDYINNPERQGAGGINRDSQMLEAILSHAEGQKSEVYKRYDGAWTAANLRNDFDPKIAFLQLREGEKNAERRFLGSEPLERLLGEKPNCDNYEIIYTKDAYDIPKTEREQQRLCESLFGHYNSDLLPSDYYGHSLSVGDVIVMTEDYSSYSAYFTDMQGFKRLPDSFLTPEMKARIRNNLDIRKECTLYEKISAYQSETALPVFGAKENARYFQFTSEYLKIFDLAEKRKLLIDLYQMGYDIGSLQNFDEAQTIIDKLKSHDDYTAPYREQVQTIYDYEKANNVPFDERVTVWVADQPVPTAKGLSEAAIFARYSEITEQEREQSKEEQGKVENVMDFPHGEDEKQEAEHVDISVSAEEKEDLSQIVAEKSAPVPIDTTLPPKDQLKQRLENGVRQVLDSEQFKNWLATGGKLFYNNYSFRNAMLVWLQKPDASYVMGYEQWKYFGRNVAQGKEAAKVFVPIKANEKFKGGLFGTIKKALNESLAKNPTLNQVSYRLGTSFYEFTLNRANGLMGLKINGAEKHIFNSDDEAKRFVERNVLGKVVTGFTQGNVFDVKDVVIPEYLWLKSGFTKEEIALDDNGKPIKNRRGETKIINTPERQARFQTSLDTRIVAKDTEKTQTLLDACVAVSERKGVPVSFVGKAEDKALVSGAKGYYSRQFSAETPNGFIVIDNDLEITEKCAVLLHEMSHSDLHKDLEALAKKMGEKTISREMREVQAEAAAFSVASTFGIETDTSSFNYLAVYAKGFDLQDFQKSLEVIYSEAQNLTGDIKSELEMRGLNLDLSQREEEKLSAETVRFLSEKHLNIAKATENDVQSALKELPSVLKGVKDNPALVEILRSQKLNLENQKSDIDIILNSVEKLNNAISREEQTNTIQDINSAEARIMKSAYEFNELTERFVIVSQEAQQSNGRDFSKDPYGVLADLKKSYPAIAALSSTQIDYIATSNYVRRELSKTLKTDTLEFVNKVVDRANSIAQIASKNGTFVEIEFCEQWTDKPFFEKGDLCSPKYANTVIAECEKQTEVLKEEAEAQGEYFPYSKCDFTVYTPDKNGGHLCAITSRVDIGDGSQKDLADFLSQICHNNANEKKLLQNFDNSLGDFEINAKISSIDKASERSSESGEKKIMTMREWKEKAAAVENPASESQNEAPKKPEKISDMQR